MGSLVHEMQRAKLGTSISFSWCKSNWESVRNSSSAYTMPRGAMVLMMRVTEGGPLFLRTLMRRNMERWRWYSIRLTNTEYELSQIACPTLPSQKSPSTLRSSWK